MGTLATKGRTGRFYVHPDDATLELPSVTTFLNIMDKPALPRWAAKLVAEYAVEHQSSWTGLPVDDATKLLKSVPWNSSGRSAQRGTDAHSYAEDRLLGLTEAKPQNTECENVERLLAMLDDMDAKLVDTECTVVSEVGQYAGTFDAIFEVRDELIMIDWKSSKGLYGSMSLQQASYRWADFYVRHDGERISLKRDDGKPTISQTYIGWIPKDGIGDLVPIKAGVEEFDAAMHARRLWEWNQENGKQIR